MHKGSCLCGTVKYEVRGEFEAAYFCHCRRCRKATGSAFASSASVASKGFTITVGEAFLKSFSTSAGVHRMFCSECGSPIISKRDHLPDIVRVRLGSLDTPLARGPNAHIYVDSKAEWFEIHDELPQHAANPPPQL